MVVKNYLTYEAYLVSDVWKCGKSPVGAHHWIHITQYLEFNQGWFMCKYCGEVKKLQVEYHPPR